MAVKHPVSDKSGDHLPYTGDDGKPDHRLMGAAWAALHGGYRGNKYEGPNKAEAISKLTALYKSEGMDTPGSSSERAKCRRTGSSPSVKGTPTVDRSVMSAGKNPPSNDPDDRFQEEKRELELKAPRPQVEGAKRDITSKKKSGKGSFTLVAIWIFLVFVILLLQGFGIAGFKLSDTVLLAAIGSITVCASRADEPG
jgi:hypothetical protein